MAISGLGMAAAIDAIPKGYEFGLRLMGQDEGALQREEQAKQAAAQLALQDRYQQGVLQNQEFANLTHRLDAENMNRYRMGGLGLERGIQPYKIAGLQASTRGQELENQYYPAVTQQKMDTDAAHAFALTKGVDNEAALIPSKIGYTNALARESNSRASEQEANNAFTTQQQQEVEALRRFSEDPWHPDISDAQRQALFTKYRFMGNPAARNAVKAFDEGWTKFQGGDKQAYTPEVQKAMGEALQPLIDQNTNLPPGSLEFDTLEPMEGGVAIKLRKYKISPEGRKYDPETTYLTEGREPMAMGGKVRVFTPQTIHQVLGGLRSAVDFQDLHPELANDVYEQGLAGQMSFGKGPAAYHQQLYKLQAARAKGEKDAAKAAEQDIERVSTLRQGFTKGAMSVVDQVYSPQAIRTKEGEKSTPYQQQLAAARENLKRVVENHLKGAPKEVLLDGNPRALFSDRGPPEVQEALRRYVDLYTSDPDAEYAPLTSGPFVNPVAPAAGGQQRPFP